MSDPVDFEAAWQFVLEHERESIRRIAERAYQEPMLRRLYPYTSLDNLHFSHHSDYPYSSLPYVLTADRYEARAADHRPLAEGSLDDVVKAVVEALASPLEP